MSAFLEPTEPAPSVGTVFFPLDEELALLPGSSLTPRQQEQIAHLSSWMPFERAAQMMERLLGVQVSDATTRRQTEQAGALAQAAQTSQAQTNTQAMKKEQGCTGNGAISIPC